MPMGTSSWRTLVCALGSGGPTTASITRTTARFSTVRSILMKSPYFQNKSKQMVDWCPFFRPQPTGLNGPWKSGPGFWSVFLSLFVDPWDEAVGKKEKEGTPTLSCTFSRWNSKLHRAGGEMAFQISSVHFTIFSYIALHLWSMSLLSNVVTC